MGSVNVSIFFSSSASTVNSLPYGASAVADPLRTGRAWG